MMRGMADKLYSCPLSLSKFVVDSTISKIHVTRQCPSAPTNRITTAKEKGSDWSLKRLHLTRRIYIALQDGVEVKCGRAYQTG